MTQEDKELLIKYLCMALPYHPVLHFVDKVQQEDEYLYGFRENGGLLQINDAYYVDEVKPYLRPMSSMTEEERQEYGLVLCDELSINQYDWLNAHHFDYRGLIPKCLAIEVTEDNNPYENNM